MKLQRVFLILAGALAIIGIGVGVTLLALTAILHESASKLEASVESVGVAEELEIQLLTYRGTRESIARVALEESVRDLIDAAAVYVSSEEERTLLDDLRRQVEVYMDAVHRAVHAHSTIREVQDATRDEFDRAFGSARRLIQLNVDQGRMGRSWITMWQRRALGIGVAAIVGLVLGLGLCVYMLRKAAIRPALALASVMEEYNRGDRSVRAKDQGAAEFRAMARRFNEMAAALEQQRNQQLAFLAGVAHDIRNPLTALQAASALVSPDRPLPTEERVRKIFARVDRQVHRLDRMVYDFLDAARIESGNFDLQLEDCDLRELAKASIELFQPTTSNHELSLQAPEQLEWVSCDPARMEQVLNNLLSNAIKYSPKGGPIQVEIRRSQRFVAVAVSDRGIGMTRAQVAQVFEPFRRTGSSKESIPGVGLGLYVARRIVEAHGGRIGVESTPGQGSTFTLQLPTRDAAALRPKARAVEPRGAPESGAAPIPTT